MSLPPSQKSAIPRRSALYMPGANARALEKARTLDADCLLLDLEDAVAPDAKAQARAQICTALEAGGYGAREIVVRVNGLDTEWGHDDLAALANWRRKKDSAPNAILAPKISTAADIDAVCAHVPDGTALWIMIETPAAIFNLDALAARAGDTPLACFVMGTNDLAKEMRAALVPGRAPLQAALSLSVLAARRYGLCVWTACSTISLTWLRLKPSAGKAWKWALTAKRSSTPVSSARATPFSHPMRTR